MTAPIASYAWVTAGGAMLGALNALSTDNGHFLPSAVLVKSDKRIIRPGLITNALIGAAACFGAFVAFDYSACDRDGLASRVPAIVVSALVGALASRRLTDAVDKRLLRSAVVKACSAPAAHADTVRAVELATPYAVYLATDRLAPPHGGFRPPS